MADGTGDLLNAFDYLAKSVQSIQIGNAIQQAQQQADAIKADQSKNDFERIKAQQALADSVAGSVLAYGGDAAHAQQARLSLAPNVPDQHLAALEATGKATIPEAQKALQEEALKKQKELETFKTNEEIRKQAAHDAMLKTIAGIKSEGKDKPKGLNQGELKDMRKAGDVGNALGRAMDQLDKMDSLQLATPELFSRDKRVFNLMQSTAQDIIQRQRSGAVLNEGESKFYKWMLGDKTAGDLTVNDLKQTLGVVQNQYFSEYNNAIKLGFARGALPKEDALRLTGLGFQTFRQRDPSMIDYIQSGGQVSGVPTTSTPAAAPAQSQQAAQPMQQAPASIPGFKPIKK